MLESLTWSVLSGQTGHKKWSTKANKDGVKSRRAEEVIRQRIEVIILGFESCWALLLNECLAA